MFFLVHAHLLILMDDSEVIPGTGFKVFDRVTFHSVHGDFPSNGCLARITEWCRDSTLGHPHNVCICIEFEDGFYKTWCRTDEIRRV